MEKGIQTAIYYRKPTAEERKGGVDTIHIVVPIRDVFLGVTSTCAAILKKSIVRDGFRFYFECINYAEGVFITTTKL